MKISTSRFFFQIKGSEKNWQLYSGYPFKWALWALLSYGPHLAILDPLASPAWSL